MAAAGSRHSAQQQFDRQAEHYDARWNSWSQASITWMLQQSTPGAGGRVLDIATGTGFTALAFAPHARHVAGLDVSTGMLAQARAGAARQGVTNISFVAGAAEALPCPDAAFDLVTCRIAPHHFTDVHKFAAEAARVVKPGGRFLLADTTVPDDDEAAAAWQNEIELARDPSHRRNYTPREWGAIVRSSGLTVNHCGAGGEGFVIPVRDWLVTAGASARQVKRVYKLLAEAPESARRAFDIHCNEEGESFVRWQRVLLSATRER